MWNKIARRIPNCGRRSLGISLLEVMLSLSIIAIVLVMATRYFFVASNNDKVNTTVSQIGGLMAAAHAWKGPSATYSGLDVKALASAGQLTNFPGYDSTAQTLTTMWGQSISISDAGASGGGMDVATITAMLPDGPTCEAVARAYPTDASANITSACAGGTLTYSFP